MRHTCIHGTRTNRIDADASAGQFLCHATGEVLDRSFGACVRGVEPGESGEQGSDDRDDLAAFLDDFGAFFDDQEGCLRVDAVASDVLAVASEVDSSGVQIDLRKHRIILRLGDLRDRFLQDHANCVHNYVHFAMLSDRILEKFLNSSAGGQVTLVNGDGQVLVGALQLILQFRGAIFARSRVVVQSKIGALLRQVTSDLCAQVLAAAGDQSCLALERHLRDGVFGK